jgi:hypothetical protein
MKIKFKKTRQSCVSVKGKVGYAIAKRSDEKLVAYVMSNTPSADLISKAQAIIKMTQNARTASFLDKYRLPV